MRNSNILKGKGFILGLCGLLFLGFAIFAITSCEDNSLEWLADDSSYEARLEEARMALDDTEYDRAISLLTKLKADYPGDPLVLQYLSNAYAGKAGLDTFNLLMTIDQLIEANETGNIDMVGLVLGDDGIVTSANIVDLLANLEAAIDELEEIPNPTHDQTVQLGLLSMNHAAMTIADIVYDNTGEQVTLTEEGLGETYGGEAPDLSEEATSERLDSLSEDMDRIGDAVDSIASITGADTTEENDLSESFDEFQGDLDTNADGAISEQELENYLGSL